MSDHILFASSANGDRWALATDFESGAAHVLHFSNPPSGGAVTRIDIPDFLNPFVGSPEQQSLLAQVGVLTKGASDKHGPLRSEDIETLRQADENDVNRALAGARIALPIATAQDALELFNCVLDVMTDQRDIDEAADLTRIVAGFGSTH